MAKDIELENELDAELSLMGEAVQSEEQASFLPDFIEEEVKSSVEETAVELDGTELDDFESVAIEDIEFIEAERLESIIESILFASDRPVSFNQIRQVFKGTQIKNDTLRRALDKMAVTLASSDRGVTLEEIQGGFQLRTKIDNLKFISRSVKPKAFRLSGPALEVLSIVAYKQPLVKSEIDQIRGVESGHLLRAIMEKGLVTFAGKSELPGRPMLYETTRKFLEIFGLRNLRELPSLSQIDEILPEGMTEDEGEKTKLSDLTGSLSQEIGHGYSEGEEELNKISNQLSDITTSSEFFDQEKIRMKMKKDQERAQALRDSIVLEEEVSTRDRNWLLKYDEAVNSGQLDAYYAKAPVAQAVEAVAESAAEGLFETEEDSSNDADMGLLETDHEDEPEAQA